MKSKEVLLGEIFDIERGGSPRPIQNFLTNDADGIPWIMIGDTEQGGKYINSTKSKIKRAGICKSREVYPGELLLSNSMSFGRPYILRTYGCIHDGWLALRPKTKEIDTNYAYHALGSQKVMAQFQKKAAGATVKNLNKAIVASTIIPLPPLEEQRRIAAILDKGRATKRLAIAASNRFESLRLSIFEELFDQTTWPTASLQDVTTRITNGYVGPTRDVYVDEGIPYLLARHVKNGQLSYCGNPKISATFNEKNKKSKLKEGDVLLVQSGHIGSSCVVPPEHHGHNCHAMIVITPMKDFLLGEYLSLLFQTQRFQRLFQSLQTGITVPHLNCRDIRKIQVPMPPIEKQVWLSERISTLSAKSMVAINRIDLISELEKSLMEQFLGFK